MIGLSQRNFRLCCIHAFCIALAIAVCANGVITDLLLLHLEFDLSKFGVIKSCMYLLPAISYFAAAGFIGKFNKDLTIAAQAYLWRVALPLILTVAAFFTRSQTVLLVLAAVIFSLSFTCAMFANNTLLKIYRNALSPGDFNQGSIFLSTLLAMPGAFFCLLAISILNRFSDNRQSFLTCLLILQLISLLFEYPGIKALMAVRFPQNAEHEKKAKQGRFADIFQNRQLRRLLALTTLHGIWTGAVSTYFVLYLLKVWHVKPQLIVGLELLLTVLALISARLLGKLADRFGYGKVVAVCLICILIFQTMWTFLPGVWVFLLIFCFVGYNGQGFFGGCCYNIESSWSAALAREGQHELFIAARTFLYSLGCFLGCSFAGPVFVRFAGVEAEQFICYFRCTLLLPLLMLLLVIPLKRLNKKTV